MKKIASILMGLALVATTTFAQARQETKKQTVKTTTQTKQVPAATAKTTTITKTSSATKMKADGTPDKRYKENKESKTTVKLKKDGTPDKRYKEKSVKKD